MQISNSKKDRQRNSQEKRDKKTNKDLQTVHRKLKIGQREPHENPGVSSGVPGG
jgi:hypothetical protein